MSTVGAEKVVEVVVGVWIGLRDAWAMRRCGDWWIPDGVVPSVAKRITASAT